MIAFKTPGALVQGSKKLTPADIKFCREYVANADLITAYIAAFPDAANKLSDKQVRTKAAGLLRREKIQKYLKQLYDSLAVSLQIDAGWVVNRFIELYEMSVGLRPTNGKLRTDIRAAVMILSKLSDYTGGFDKNDKTSTGVPVKPVINISVVDNNTSVELQNTINILSENKTPAKQAHPQGKPRETEYTEITKPEQK